MLDMPEAASRTGATSESRPSHQVVQVSPVTVVITGSSFWSYGMRYLQAAIGEGDRGDVEAAATGD